MLLPTQLSKWQPCFSFRSLITIAGCNLILGAIVFFYLFRAPSLDSLNILSFQSREPTALESYLDLLDRTGEYHPIDELILDSDRTLDHLLLKRATDVKSAAANYRDRRGRHPPPGFDKWVEYALAHDAILVEQFFDRIDKDLRPFWALNVTITASQAGGWEHVIRVRNGAATGVGDVTGRVPWLKLWTELIAEAAQWLPDVDIPINYMDESRIMAPWDDINTLVQIAESNKSITPPDETLQTYTGLGHTDEVPTTEWIRNARFWDLARKGCPPDSPGRDAAAIQDFSEPPLFPQNWSPSFSRDMFVQNYSASMDPCVQPHLRSLHGTFVAPVTMATSQTLIPMFSGCKILTNNDILLPGAMYLTSDARYSGGNGHGPPWSQKTGGVIWRGVGSGGRHAEQNWAHFQRHRLLQMLNGSTVSAVEHGAVAPTFVMPDPGHYNISKSRIGHLGEWISEIADVGFTELLCFPRGECDYLEPYYSEVNKIPMKKQFAQKYIPDVDGNSFSARFRSLLLSTSLPLKSTIYAEWHDDRLFPWLHFAPLDNSLQDLYAVLDYFTYTEKGDAAARYIAESGKAWAEKVLRREDMLLYTWRLALEFARVCDENRDRLGFVQDIV